jgi:hypothetical protein
MNCDESHELPSAFDGCNSIHGASQFTMLIPNSAVYTNLEHLGKIRQGAPQE